MTVQLRHDIWDMTIGVTIGQNSPDRSIWTGRPDRTAMTFKKGQDVQEITARTGQRGKRALKQDSWVRTSGEGQLGQDSWDRTAGEDSRDSRTRTGKRG
jgi:hypothetical protein